MTMKKLNLLFFLLFCTLAVLSQTQPLWMRYPAISPDGKYIAFSYKGDIYKVASKGGEAIPLTIHKAHEFRPVWSPDGKTLAFASDRYGNYDVFIVSANGGKAKRLTWNSANQYPTCFSVDSKNILFFSSIIDSPENIQFPKYMLSELYSVPVSGGRYEQILTTPAEEAKYNQSGTKIVYQDRKGYEDIWRKHHTSSITRDIWIYDLETKFNTKISGFEGEDLYPVFHPNGESVYYLSEKNGSANVYLQKSVLKDSLQQITFHEKHPVRFLSVSNSGVLCYAFNGEIWIKDNDKEPVKVNIEINYGKHENETEFISETSGATEMALSPNGKEIAFIIRGNIFVKHLDFSTTRQITFSSGQERSVSFSPDGVRLLYASERNGSWSICESKIKDKQEKYFTYATEIGEKTIIDNGQETFQPAYSPNGKEIAFLENRTTIKVLNTENNKIRLILDGKNRYSYADGDQHFEWSPDGKWFLYSSENNLFISDIFLIDAKGQQTIANLSKSGYNDVQPHWGCNGNMVYWFSDKEGMHEDVTWWGTQSNVYGSFFNNKAYTMFNYSQEDIEAANLIKKYKQPSEFEVDKIEARSVKLTRDAFRLSDAILNNDGSELYTLAMNDGKYDLRVINTETGSSELITSIAAAVSVRMWKNANDGSSMQLDKDGKNLYVFIGGKITKVDTNTKKLSNISYNVKYELNYPAERSYIFNHAWKQVKEKFYVQDLHGVDWDFYKKEYEKFLPHIANNFDFAEMLSEILGELNGSHTGARFYPSRLAGDDATGKLAVFFDRSYTGNGLKINEIVDKSPLLKANKIIDAGMIIEKVNGSSIDANIDFYKYFNHTVGQRTILTIYDPKSKERWNEVVKPVSSYTERQLLYDRWIKKCRETTKKHSKGRIGYVHVKSMDDASYRNAFSEVFGRYRDAEAVIIDTRYNGGGWIHDDLSSMLNGYKYLEFHARGSYFGIESMNRWAKPSIVVMSEGNYSDAYGFPYAYSKQKIGKLVGMPVPGTMTAVWWETQVDNSLVFGIPQMGTKDEKGDFLENKQIEPDVKVFNHPDEMKKGTDQQLLKAIEVMLKSLDER